MFYDVLCAGNHGIPVRLLLFCVFFGIIRHLPLVYDDRLFCGFLLSGLRDIYMELFGMDAGLVGECDHAAVSVIHLFRLVSTAQYP